MVLYCGLVSSVSACDVSDWHLKVMFELRDTCIFSYSCTLKTRGTQGDHISSTDPYTPSTDALTPSPLSPGLVCMGLKF